METSFWLNQIIKVLILYAVAYTTGLWVQKTNIKVNYTRKINHFVLFFLPQILMKLNPSKPTVATVLVAALVGILTLVIYIRPLRRRSPTISTMFASYDRPEDRPFTLLWLSTQVIVSYAVIISLMIYFINQASH